MEVVSPWLHWLPSLGYIYYSRDLTEHSTAHMMQYVHTSSTMITTIIAPPAKTFTSHGFVSGQAVGHNYTCTCIPKQL